MSKPINDIPWLPEELYHTILEQLKPSRTSDESVVTLTRCTATNKALRAIAIAPTLWQAHYNIRYTHEDEQHTRSRQDEMMTSCHVIYGRRRLADKQAVQMLDDLVRFEGGSRQRHDNAQDIVENYSFDVWDALEIEVSRHTATPTATCMTRTWWAQNLLGTITRHQAISTWMEVHVTSVGLRGSFERIFNALSSFFDCSHHQIQSKFDTLAARCRDFLSEHEIVMPPSSPASSLREICEKIVDFMTVQGFGPVSDDDFTRLMNSFPHFFLGLNHEGDESGKRSIPISLTHVFCSIASRLNFDAHPLNFPNRVIARVCVVPGVAGPEDVYVDIFSGKVLSRSDGIPGLLQATAIGDVDAEEALSLVPVGDLLMRAARNIFNCLSTIGPGTVHPGTRAVRSASYAALAALAASTVRIQPPPVIGASAAEQLPACLPHAPLDAVPIMQNLLSPALPWQVGAKLGKGVKAWLDEDIEDGAKVQRRKGKETQTKRVRWFVGCHFKHRMFGYTGVVVGWTSKCEASEDWIRQMGVDGLPNGGRRQPFYNIIDSDEQRRYVADCNIIPTKELTDEMVATMSQTCPAMGQYFSRLSPPTEHGRRRFLLSAESSSCYPEDDELGQQWVDTGEVEEIELTGPLGAVFTLGLVP